MKNLFILNDPPYGTERNFNALRLALALLKQEGEDVRLFLMADAAACAKTGQTLPSGFYSLERMVKAISSRGGLVGICGSCMDARGIKDEEILPGTSRSTMDELAGWTAWADKVLVF